MTRLEEIRKHYEASTLKDAKLAEQWKQDFGEHCECPDCGTQCFELFLGQDSATSEIRYLLALAAAAEKMEKTARILYDYMLVEGYHNEELLNLGEQLAAYHRAREGQ